MRERYAQIDRELLPLLPDDSECRETLGRKIPKAGNIADYIQRNASYPVYQNTDVIYYDEAVKGLEAQLADLAKAEKFILWNIMPLRMHRPGIKSREFWKTA